jgi:hypothetical protein
VSSDAGSAGSVCWSPYKGADGTFEASAPPQEASAPPEDAAAKMDAGANEASSTEAGGD